MSKTVLIVDDEKNTREGLKWALERTVADIRLAEDGEKALALIREHPVDLVITDLKMPAMDDMELLHYLR